MSFQTRELNAADDWLSLRSLILAKLPGAAFEARFLFAQLTTQTAGAAPARQTAAR
ncbi:hypothetical protein ACPOL_4343 [Acidisarcina polymorpha]|uniref:Uncharacterized protein n=1 Tax=Acidisarcina polymorpha TaxID=2211140 RepID=A0A2Z5G3D0_9BACT|nr:hypothetical protein ACPOL_4343 [Acidisarcina polymorpha]